MVARGCTIYTECNFVSCLCKVSHFTSDPQPLSSYTEYHFSRFRWGRHQALLQLTKNTVLNFMQPSKSLRIAWFMYQCLNLQTNQVPCCKRLSRLKIFPWADFRGNHWWLVHPAGPRKKNWVTLTLALWGDSLLKKRLSEAQKSVHPLLYPGH